MSARLAKRELVQPDHLTGPRYVQTFGPEVAELNALAGFAPDPQQELALDHIFAVNENGFPASFSFCVICCRQNLKTGLFKQAVLGWLFVLDIRLVVWSAHEMGTTREAHRDLAELIHDTPILRKRLDTTPNEGIYDANGQERIELKNGQRLLFKARTLSGGRGLSGDKTILDEAFALKPSHVGSLLPTMMARPEGQVLYGSSAGKADSDVLRDVRDRGRSGSSKRMSYIEWLAPKRECADDECTHAKSGVEGCALDDPELWRKANPTLTTGRITLERIEDMRQELPPEEFARECLGWWEDPVDEAETFFGAGRWESCSITPSDPPKVDLTLAIARSVDQSWTSIAAVAKWPDGRKHVGAVRRGTGVGWAVDEVKRIQKESGCLVALDGGGPAASMIQALTDAGVRFEAAKTVQVLNACANFYDEVRNQTVTHFHHEELDDAIAGAKKRSVGDRWAIGRKTSAFDVSMLEAAIIAAFYSDFDRTYNVLDSIF